MIKKIRILSIISGVLPYIGIALITWFMLPYDRKANLFYILFCLCTGLSFYLVKQEYSKRFSKKSNAVSVSDAARAGTYVLLLDEDEKTELAADLGYRGAKFICSADGMITWRDIHFYKNGNYLLLGIPDRSGLNIINKGSGKADFVFIESFFDKLEPHLPKKNSFSFKDILSKLDLKKCLTASVSFIAVYLLTDSFGFLFSGLLLFFVLTASRHFNKK